MRVVVHGTVAGPMGGDGYFHLKGDRYGDSMDDLSVEKSGIPVNSLIAEPAT